MKTALICGIFATGLLGVLGFEQYTEGTTQSDVTHPETAYELPTTTPVAVNYQPYQPFWSTYYGVPFESDKPCSHEITDQVLWGYRNSIYNVSAHLYKRISALTNSHFVFSPQTTFLTMAAMFEGCDGPTCQQIAKFLNLPEDGCLREAFYHLALSREHHGNDVIFARNRLFVADSSIHVNKKWEEFAKTYANVDTVSVPFKSNHLEIEALKKQFKVHLPHLSLNGNSMFLESLDFSALWTSVFSDAIIEQGPFYDNSGVQLGYVEYMKVSKRANIGFIPSYNMKVIDLPIGREGKYRMYIAVSLGKANLEHLINNIASSVIFEVISNLKESLEPVEIVLPKMNMTSEIDMRQLFEEIGIKSLWTDPTATRRISEPSALPSTYTQRVTMHMDASGVRPAIPEYHNFVPPLHYTHTAGYVKPGYSTYSANPTHWSEYNPMELTSFIANKPFLFGIFDAQSYTGVLQGLYSKVY